MNKYYYETDDSSPTRTIKAQFVNEAIEALIRKYGRTLLCVYRENGSQMIMEYERPPIVPIKEFDE